MRIVKIEVDDKFAEVIQFSCIGREGERMNVCYSAYALDNGCHFIVSKEGKIVQSRGEMR